MLNAALKLWVRSGVDTHSVENINPTLITNVIALLVCIVLVMQMPIALWLWQENGNIESLMLAFHLLLLTFIPLLNRLKLPQQAKLTLIVTFTSYICLSCLLWVHDLDIQYFLLLGVFACPFIFEPHQKKYNKLSMLLFCIIFVSIQGIYIWREFEMGMAEHLAVVTFSSAVFFALSSGLLSYYIGKNVNSNSVKLAQEKQRADRILLSIFPASIASRLKKNEQPIADHFEQVSILFADIVDFTKLVRHNTPDHLVTLLDGIFRRFDKLALAHNLEKIKTIGDGYMAAAGIPKSSDIHALQCCSCALDMRQIFQQFCQESNLQCGLRIGIGTGEVTAGVIGQHKPCYDLWGEAVTLASRLETYSEPAKIQVSVCTYELAKHKFHFEKRGTISIKGMDLVTTYWLLGPH